MASWCCILLAQVLHAGPPCVCHFHGLASCFGVRATRERRKPAMLPPIPIPGFHDPFSFLSHLLGAVVLAVLSVPLLRRGWGGPVRVAALGVYVFSCVFLLSMSDVCRLLPLRTNRGRTVSMSADAPKMAASSVYAVIATPRVPVTGTPVLIRATFWTSEESKYMAFLGEIPAGHVFRRLALLSQNRLAHNVH